jgi:hypothetical protein
VAKGRLRSKRRGKSGPCPARTAIQFKTGLL